MNVICGDNDLSVVPWDDFFHPFKMIIDLCSEQYS